MIIINSTTVYELELPNDVEATDINESKKCVYWNCGLQLSPTEANL